MYRLCKRKHELCSDYGVSISQCKDYVEIMFVPLDYARFMFAEFNWKLGYD